MAVSFDMSPPAAAPNVTCFRVAFPAIATWFPEHQRHEASKVKYEKVDDSKNILEEDPFEAYRRQQQQQQQQRTPGN